VQEKIAALEKRIAAWEAEKLGLEHAMADPESYRDGERTKAAHARYAGVQNDLTGAYYRWDELSKELERLNRLLAEGGE
jgi:hypothetical protein